MRKLLALLPGVLDPAGVAATAPCPVAVIRDADARRDSPTFSGRVAVGVDGSGAAASGPPRDVAYTRSWREASAEPAERRGEHLMGQSA